jgi:glycosyltransferase involved in cell wall biosynthesis
VKQHPDIELAILGDGDDVARLAALVEELGLGDSVSLSQGFVPIDQLRPILAAASAGIVPIANDSFTRYMLPVKLLEYVALGIPVICSRTETIEAYFDDTMLSYFTSGDVDGLAASIVALRRDPGVGAQLAKRAALFLEEHDWPHERERYFGVVDSLLNDRDLERIPERSSAIPGGSHAD